MLLKHVVELLVQVYDLFIDLASEELDSLFGVFKGVGLLLNVS